MDSQPNVLKCNLWLSTIQIQFKLFSMAQLRHPSSNSSGQDWKICKLLIAAVLGHFCHLGHWSLKHFMWTPDFVSRMTFESFKIVCFSNVLRWVQAYITVYLLKTYELFWSPATRPFIHLGSYGTHVIRLQNWRKARRCHLANLISPFEPESLPISS